MNHIHLFHLLTLQSAILGEACQPHHPPAGFENSDRSNTSDSNHLDAEQSIALSPLLPDVKSLLATLAPDKHPVKIQLKNS